MASVLPSPPPGKLLQWPSVAPDTPTPAQRARYDELYPEIERRARRRSRWLRSPEQREENAQAIIGWTWALYVDACRNRSDAQATARTLVDFASQRVATGRRLDRNGRGRDVMDRCQRVYYDGPDGPDDEPASLADCVPGPHGDDPAINGAFNVDLESFLRRLPPDFCDLARRLAVGWRPAELQRFLGDETPYYVRYVLGAFLEHRSTK
jgi:hypothetical protein